MGIRKLNQKRKKKVHNKQEFFRIKKLVKKQEKQIFDLQQLLEISKSLNSLIEFRRLMESIRYVVMAQMKTFRVAIFIKKNFDDENFVLYDDAYGFDIHKNLKYTIPKNHQLIKILNKTDTCLVSDKINKILNASTNDDEVVKNLLSMDVSLFVPMKVKKHLVGFLLLGEQIENSSTYDKYEQDMILSIANLAAIAIYNTQLLEMTTTDMMTQLKLKHYFFAVLSEKMEACTDESPLSVLMLDIDDFKKINDTYGHSCGDIVLQQVANIIQTSVRTTDLAARYGGEEFSIILPCTDVKAASIIAERIRIRIEKMEVEYEDKKIHLTISIGIAQYLPDDKNEKELIKRSDVALYNCKHNGKNQWSISKENLEALKDEKNKDSKSLKTNQKTESEIV